MGVLSLLSLFCLTSTAAEAPQTESYLEKAIAGVKAPESTPKWQQYFPEWKISGSSTTKWEYYKNTGDPASNPHANVGPQFFNDFQVKAERKLSDFEKIKWDVSGVYNDSEFRLKPTGLIFERFNLLWEKGDVVYPFRAQVGDFFAKFSLSALQRSLKGAHIDIQPKIGGPDWRHSLEALHGFSQSNFRDIDPQRERFTGVAWRSQHKKQGAYGANVVYHRKDDATNQNSINQVVASALAERRIQWKGQKLKLEGEVGHFRGDVGAGDAVNEKDEVDHGIRVIVSGRDEKRPLDYKVRYEQYGENFRPTGGSVSANRQTIEAGGGWRFENGVRASGRYQYFKNNMESTNPSFVHSLSGNVSGAFFKKWWEGSSSSYRGFIRDTRDKDDGTDTLSISHSLNTNGPIKSPYEHPWTQGWTAQLGASYVLNENQQPNGKQTIARQLQMTFSRALELFGFKGSISPGLNISKTSGNNTRSRDFSPTLSVSLSKGSHAIGFNYNAAHFNRREDGTKDLFTQGATATYSYTHGPHRFGVEVDFRENNPEKADDTYGYKGSAFYTFTFDRPVIKKAPTAIKKVTDAPKIDPLTVVINQWPLNVSYDELKITLEKQQFKNPTTQGEFVIYDAAVLDAIAQRQRLVLVQVAEVVNRIGVIIDFEDAGDADGAVARDIFETVKNEMITQYGEPSFTKEEGGFGGNFIADVNAEELIRLYEWHTDAGVMRFGIPRRLDRAVRIEIQYAKRFTPPENTLWSLENVK